MPVVTVQGKLDHMATLDMAKKPSISMKRRKGNLSEVASTAKCHGAQEDAVMWSGNGHPGSISSAQQRGEFSQSAIGRTVKHPLGFASLTYSLLSLAAWVS